ncbi:MAG: hypothetical protein H6740_10725 [Alphaproteobacteria bacterium]|nr:hypothetical protein [Alphaproteobacteria bacterium]
MSAPPPRPPDLKRQLHRRARSLRELAACAASGVVTSPIALANSLRREAQLLEALAEAEPEPPPEEDMPTLRPGQVLELVCLQPGSREVPGGDVELGAAEIPWQRDRF